MNKGMQGSNIVLPGYVKKENHLIDRKKMKIGIQSGTRLSGSEKNGLFPDTDNLYRAEFCRFLRTGSKII